MGIDWKSIIKEVIRVILAGLAGAVSGGCISIPFIF